MERDVLVVGEALVDIVHARDGSVSEHPGGSAANVAVALSRLGRRVRLATSFADDAHGRLVAAHLAAAGVELVGNPHAVTRTSTARARLGPDGSADYEFDLDWRLSPPDAEAVTSAVHVCSLGAVLSPGAEVVGDLVRRARGHALISYDVNVRPAITGTGPDLVGRVEAVARLADLLKASDEDLVALYPALSPEHAVRRLLALGPAAVVLTRGAGGATWFGRSLEVHVASAPVAVVDTIGAGDTFAAALLDGLLAQDRIGDLAAVDQGVVTEVLGRAARASAVTVSRAGADPPYRAELA